LVLSYTAPIEKAWWGIGGWRLEDGAITSGLFFHVNR